MFLSRAWRVSLFCISCIVSSNLSAQPQVSASIPPLQFIAAALTDGVSIPSLILGGGQDPHHPSLKPSQRQALADADIFLWVGPDLERSLEKVVNELEAEIITALDLAGMQRHLVRGSVDPHIWLNTENARVIAKELVQRLIKVDPENAERYQINLQDFEASLLGLDVSITASLSRTQNNTYAVYHNALQYFEQQFGLQHVVSFTEDEELKPAIKQLLEIKKALQENNVRCLLVEPDVNTQELNNIVNLPQYVTVDVLGSAFSPTKSAYVELMRSLTDAMLECLR